MFKCITSLYISKFVLCKPKNILLSSLKTTAIQKCYCSAFNRPLNLKVGGGDIPLDKYVTHLENEYNQLTSLRAHLKPPQENRLKELESIMQTLNDRNNLVKYIENLEDLISFGDMEMKRMAEEERTEYWNKIKKIDGELLETLLPFEPQDNCHAIMLEVNTGVGGQEAMLFARELFYMYCSFIRYKNWKLEVAGYLTTDFGGVRHATALIEGKNIYRYFKYEAGVHRVQRIPATEKAGRVHTSTVSVLVLPQPSDIEIVIDSKDLRIETKRASGAGGQHVNTTDSAVRITHIPTEISVECQTDRSQIQNKKIAMQKLRAILYERKQRAQNEKIASVKKEQVKSNFRNEKIRTYNFSQDRITDHRLQNCNIRNLKGFLMGKDALEDLMNKLYMNSRIESLLETISKLDNKNN